MKYTKDHIFVIFVAAANKLLARTKKNFGEQSNRGGDRGVPSLRSGSPRACSQAMICGERSDEDMTDNRSFIDIRSCEIKA